MRLSSFKEVARAQRSELVAAVLAFAGLCIAGLWHPVQQLEPDDSAYKGAITALSKFHVKLTQAQYQAIGQPRQWIRLADGHYVSEKNPGYAFLAVSFQWMHALRAAPFFYGAIGCVGLYLGARRWLGRWAGAVVVALFCLNGASIAFAWRVYMPTFTEAALIAGFSGLLVWSLLATEFSDRRRTAAGVVAFACLEAAVLSRYTNGVILLAALGVLFSLRWVPNVPRLFRRLCLVTVAVTGLLAFSFNKIVYGGILNTGYSGGSSAADTGSGAFSVQAIQPNVSHLWSRLVHAMPMGVLAVIAFVWIVVRYVRGGADGVDNEFASTSTRDVAVGGFLALAWLFVWGLYSMFEWTTQMGLRPGGDVHVIRFYLPVLGLVALLATWFVVHVTRLLPRAFLTAPIACVCAVVIAGVVAGSSLITDTRGPGGPGGRGGPGGFGGPHGQFGDGNGYWSPYGPSDSIAPAVTPMPPSSTTTP